MITKDDFVGYVDGLFFFNPPSDEMVSWSRDTGAQRGWSPSSAPGGYTAFEVIDDKLFFLEMQGGEPLCVRSIDPDQFENREYWNPAFVDAYADWFL